MSQLTKPYAAVTVIEGGKTIRYFKDADDFFCGMVDCADADMVEARAWLANFLGGADSSNLDSLLELCRSRFDLIGG